MRSAWPEDTPKLQMFGAAAAEEKHFLICLWQQSSGDIPSQACPSPLIGVLHRHPHPTAEPSYGAEALPRERRLVFLRSVTADGLWRSGTPAASAAHSLKSGMRMPLCRWCQPPHPAPIPAGTTELGHVQLCHCYCCAILAERKHNVQRGLKGYEQC